MDLIINSLYSDRDTFMRELVSNYSAYLVADKATVVTKSMQDRDFRNYRLLGWLALLCPIFSLCVDGFIVYGTRAVS
jgi:hypothetical protein